VILDELQEQQDEDSWSAAEPMIRTSPNGMLVAIGTASSDGAVLFRRLYERGRQATADPRSDPRYTALVWEAPSDDDAGILAANPAEADGLLELDVLRSTRKSQTPARFASETLNRWITDDVFASFPPGSWEACAEPESRAPAEAVPAFAVDVAPGWGRATIAAAVVDDDAERLHVELARDWPDVGRAVPESVIVGAVRELAERYPGARIGYDPFGSPISSAMRRLQDEGLPIVPVGGAAFRSACGAFLGAVVTRRLRHLGDPVLGAAVRAAARSEDAEAWRWIRRRSAGPIDALCAATIACQLAEDGARWHGIAG
jgi:phage terminase large subunit-like protein